LAVVHNQHTCETTSGREVNARLWTRLAPRASAPSCSGGSGDGSGVVG
jgi:hypothetical protein